MHSEPPQNPNIASAEPGAAAPNPNCANQPPLRFNCDTAQPATSQTTPKCTCTKVKTATRQDAHHRRRHPDSTTSDRGATRGVRGVVPPEKHCEPMARALEKGPSIGRRRVATG